jgi:predicted dehydrogenase
MGRRLPIKVLLAGCDDEIQLRVVPALVKAVQKRAGKVELAAVYGTVSSQAQSAKEKYSFGAAGTDLDELFRIAAPAAIVCALAGGEVPALLHRGAPTLLLPPLGKGLDDVLAISEAARQSSALHMVAMTRRFNPYLCRAVQWARQLGEIRSLRAHLKTPGEVDGPFVWTAAVHAIDAVANILGRIDGFELARGESASAPVLATLRFANQAQGLLELTGRADHTEESYELIGDGFQAVVVLQSLAGPSMQCWRGPSIEVRIAAAQNEPAVEHDGLCEVLGSFMDTLAGDGRLAPTLENVMPAFDLAHRLAGELTPVAAA